MKPAVLFDFDGTLVDSETCILACFAHLFERYSSKELFTHKIQEEVLGPPLDQMLKRLFPQEDTEKLMMEYRRYQVDKASDLIQPMSHCLELLAYLKEEGYPVGIISTRKQDSLYYHMKRLNMTPYIDIVVGGDRVEKQKPDPEGILKAMKDVQATEGVYIGDNVMDIEAGKAAHLKTVAKLGHEGKIAKLKAAEPDAMIEDLIELKEFLGQL